jgi:hypothetical protein
MAKWFSFCAFARMANAAPCSSSVRIVIADNAIAAPLADIAPGSTSTGKPTAAINRVRKAGSIIASGNGNTVSARLRERAGRA